MGRIATSFAKQIQTLKDRGMNFDLSEEKVKEILLDIGYYRLGFYWKPFEKDEHHNFHDNTKFSDVVDLYYIDFDLRNVLLRYTNRIEINFRTKLVYYVSNKYKNYPTWFSEREVMNYEFLDELDKYYSDRFIKDNKPIKAHHKKYQNDTYAPAWKTLEFFTFGVILNIYRNLKDIEIKERISELLGVKNYNKFINLIETVVLVRNFSAHGDVLFDLRTPKGISVIPGINFENSDRQSLNACIKVISYFLENISTNRKIEFEKRVKEIFVKSSENEIIRDIITKISKYNF